YGLSSKYTWVSSHPTGCVITNRTRSKRASSRMVLRRRSSSAAVKPSRLKQYLTAFASSRTKGRAIESMTNTTNVSPSTHVDDLRATSTVHRAREMAARPRSHRQARPMSGGTPPGHGRPSSGAPTPDTKTQEVRASWGRVARSVVAAHVLPSLVHEGIRVHGCHGRCLLGEVR